VDLRQEVEEAVRILKQTIPRMVQIQCNLENDLWHIYADPVQIEQVVLNLGKNAADAMPQGGRIHIEAKNVHLSDELQPADIALKPGDYVLLRIKDTGHGMDPEILEHIFDPFFTTKEVGSGTGLGLSTVYGIVQTHQGHIQCHSQPREETVFSIYWPTTQAEDKAEQKQKQSAEELPQGTGTILVVDDEGAYIDMMQIVLSQSGYTVLVAANGEEALQIYSKQSAGIDLVILDLSMSGMGGEQCLQEILKTDPEARILVASGYSSEHAAKDIMQKEAAAFIGKPFQLSDLLSKVQEMLNTRQGVNNN
jgi:CheY-like chemotaxis protein